MNVHFEELVGDFIKDDSGRYWLVNIKAFKVVKWENFILRNLLEYDDYGEKDITLPPVNILKLFKDTNFPILIIVSQNSFF